MVIEEGYTPSLIIAIERGKLMNKRDENRKIYINELKSQIKDLTKRNEILKKENSDLKKRLDKTIKDVKNITSRFEVLRDIQEKVIEKARIAEVKYKKLILEVKTERKKYSKEVSALINEIKKNKQ